MVRRPRREYTDHHVKEIKQKINVRGKKKQEQDTFKFMFFYASLVFTIGFLIIIYINQYVHISRLNFQIEKFEKLREELKADNAHLQLEISQLKSLSRIEEFAKRNLDMEEPVEINYVVAKSDEVGEKNKVSVDKVQAEEVSKRRSLKSRLLVWINSLSEVQAGTLDE